MLKNILFVFTLCLLNSANLLAQTIIFQQPSIPNIDKVLFVNPIFPTPNGVFSLGQNVNASPNKDVPIPWRMGDFTNFYPKDPLKTQRGLEANWYGGSGFQAEGDIVGININTETLLRPTTPKPSTIFPFVVQYNFPSPTLPFKDPKKVLTYSMDLQIPSAQVRGGAVAYANMVFLFRDRISGLFFWLCGSVFDVRGSSAKIEFVARDDWNGAGATHYANVGSVVTRPGESFNLYTTQSPTTSNQLYKPWKGFINFNFSVSRNNLKRIIADFKKNNCADCAWNKFSDDPSNYELFHFNFDPEIFYTEGSFGQMGLSLKNIKISLEKNLGIPFHRFYNPKTNRHFYTASVDEAKLVAQSLVYEKPAGRIFQTADEGDNLVPLYRLHSPSARDHFYTTSASERDLAIKAFGYKNEGIAGYLPPQTSPCRGMSLHRLYSPKSGHFYTVSSGERDLAIKKYGMKSEAAYCMP